MDKLLRLIDHNLINGRKRITILKLLRFFAALEYDTIIAPTDAELWEERN